jgi:hypothetical protein
MSQINPFAGPLQQSSPVVHQQAADKSRQVRQRQDVSKNVTARPDEFEHAVENTEALAPIHEEGSKEQPQKRRPKSAKAGKGEKDSEKEESHIDLKA